MEPAFHRGNVTGRPVIKGTEQETSLVIRIPDDKFFKEVTGGMQMMEGYDLGHQGRSWRRESRGEA